MTFKIKTMTTLNKHQLIKQTFENTLLHLYMIVGGSKTFITTPQRNKIIIDFIKPKVKQAKYKMIKNKLKLICLMKNKFGSIESYLVDILNQYHLVANKNDVDKLYSLLTSLEKVGIETQLIEETPNQRENVAYLDRAHIDNCFDDSCLQIAPVSLFIHTSDITLFTRCLQEQHYFVYELYQSNETLGNYHFQLHPKVDVCPTNDDC